MAQFYFRTREEFIEDDLLCAEHCDHLDCAETRIQLTYPCPYCGKPVAGSAAMIEHGRLCHTTCVVAALES